jgi:hypothetical protein
MGIRTTDDLERTMQRLTLVERRLERLEALVRDQGHPHAASEADAVPRGNLEHSRSADGGGELRFPEIRLQLAGQATPERTKEPGMSNARAAIEAYPHLLQPLCTLWGHPEFDRYVSRLLVDERGGRKGFSGEVVEELLFLAQLNHYFCPSWVPRDPWEDAQFIGDRM